MKKYNINITGEKPSIFGSDREGTYPYEQEKVYE